MTRKENAPMKGCGNCVADTHNFTKTEPLLQSITEDVTGWHRGKIPRVSNRTLRRITAKVEKNLAKQGWVKAVWHE